MKNMIKKLCLFSLVGFASTANAALTSTEVALNNYYRDQANKQIEQILPKGKFSVQVNLKVNTTKMKSDLDLQPVKLPLGGSFVSGSELKASGAVDQTIERLIMYVEKVNIVVSLAPGISGQAQELITNTLQSMVELDVKRGDAITFMDLPESVINAWSPEPNIEVYKKPAMVVSGFFGLMLLLAAFIVMFGMKQVGNHITREARTLTGTLKEAIEAGGTGGSAMGNMQMPQSSMMNSQISQGNKSEGFESNFSQFWDKVDADTITAFCFDCISQPIYNAIPSMMVGTFLDPQKAGEVENNLPMEFLRNFNEKSNLKSSDVIQVFQKYQSEYRRAVKSPMSQQVLRVDIQKIIDFGTTLPHVEVALLINSLTPLKRSSLLKALSTDVKMDLAKASQENMSIVEHKKMEISLIEKIMTLTKNDNQKEEFHSLNYLTSIILKTESFADDEALYEKMDHHGNDYQGILLAFDFFQSADWEEISPQDLAIAFCGYSEKYKSMVIDKFSGKKLEWVKNFFSKYERSQLDFHNDQVEAIQDIIKARIKSIKTASGDHSEQKQAV